MGRCAIEGTNCSPDAAVDGAGPDNNTSLCGNGESMPGEICFKEPVEYDTGVAGIFDAQFIDGNADGMLDLAFLNSTNYLFRLSSGGTFETSNTAGGAAMGARRMIGGNLNANMNPELIHNNSATGSIEILAWNGIDWTLASESESELADARGIAVGKLDGPTSSLSIVMVFQDTVRAYLLPDNGQLQPLVQAGNGIAITGGRDVAVGDLDNDGVAEIAVADDAGIEVFRGAGSEISPKKSPTIGMPVDAVAICDVDGGNDKELVYSIKSTNQMPGRVGVARWIASSSSYELPVQRMIPHQGAPLECVDLDKDGHGDAIVGAQDGANNFHVLVLRGRPDGTFEPPIEFPVPRPGTSFRANASFNGDMVNDIAITSSLAGYITVLESNP